MGRGWIEHDRAWIVSSLTDYGMRDLRGDHPMPTDYFCGPFLDSSWFETFYGRKLLARSLFTSLNLCDAVASVIAFTFAIGAGLSCCGLRRME
jgi:hypothetical protein